MRESDGFKELRVYMDEGCVVLEFDNPNVAEIHSLCITKDCADKLIEQLVDLERPDCDTCKNWVERQAFSMETLDMTHPRHTCAKRAFLWCLSSRGKIRYKDMYEPKEGADVR